MTDSMGVSTMQISSIWVGIGRTVNSKSHFLTTRITIILIPNSCKYGLVFPKDGLSAEVFRVRSGRFEALPHHWLARETLQSIATLLFILITFIALANDSQH